MPLVYHLSSVHIRHDVRVFFKECVSLANAGYIVHLIVADGLGDQRKNRVVIHDLGKPNGRLQRILLCPFKLFLKAVKAKADLYHFHDPELLPVGLLLKMFTKASVIYDVHESYPDKMRHKEYLNPLLGKLLSHGIKWLENRVASRMDAVITVMESHRERFSKTNPRTVLIRNYPMISEWRSYLPEISEKHPNSLCYVGSITRARGISVLIKAVETLDVSLHLAGSYDPAAYREELMSLPGWGKVVEHGFLNREKAVHLMAGCRIGVMLLQPEPNYINSLATKLFEYMAAGCAVLVSDFKVYRDLVLGSGCGLCVNPVDPTEVSLAIQSMLAKGTDLIAIGQIGSLLITERFNWENEEVNLHKLYTDLLGDLNCCKT